MKIGWQRKTANVTAKEQVEEECASGWRCGREEEMAWEETEEEGRRFG
jgi:hypothetical protein